LKNPNLVDAEGEVKAVYPMKKGCLSEERIHLAAFLFEKEKVMEITASAGTVLCYLYTNIFQSN